MIRPILRHQSARTLLRYLAEFAGVPVVRLESFLGASPLRRTMSDWLDWESVRANLEPAASTRWRSSRRAPAPSA